jgi:hypothetical protein
MVNDSFLDVSKEVEIQENEQDPIPLMYNLDADANLYQEE